VKIFDLGELRNSSYYFIDMELCDMTLKDFITSFQASRSSQGESDLPYRAPDQEIWTIMMQIASGLEYIHSEGEVHRDLKPANGIFLLH
jgi:serine/threonine protein kinase